MKLIVLIKDLFEKAGVKITEKEADEFLKLGTIQDVEIPDALATQVNTGLMNLTAAENNPNIRAKLIGIGRSEAFDGVDSEINNTMTELGLTDDVKAKILAEKSTTKRAALLAKEVKAASDKGGANTKEMTEQINALNKKISDSQNEFTEKLKQKDSEFAEKFLSQSINFDLASGFSYIFPDETPMETKLAAAMASVSRRLAADGVKVITDEAGNKKIVKKDGTDYYDSNNKKVEYRDYLTAALTQDNLLVASKDSNPGAGKNQPPKIIPGEEGKGDQSFLAAADADLANLEGAMKRDAGN